MEHATTHEHRKIQSATMIYYHLRKGKVFCSHTPTFAADSPTVCEGLTGELSFSRQQLLDHLHNRAILVSGTRGLARLSSTLLLTYTTFFSPSSFWSVFLSPLSHSSPLSRNQADPLPHRLIVLYELARYIGSCDIEGASKPNQLVNMHESDCRYLL